jgi:hypothetical protein
MKLHTTHANIERGGVHAESSFTIKTNALSFSILSSGLYTDPEMAIVRELSCNAYDAHVAAGNQQTPFEIHLPNDLEPFLSIKDFGIGLSDKDIQGELVPVMVEDSSGEMIQALDEAGDPRYSRGGGLYTTYFDSTKTNSNDFIGALGLGSKSPFSYSDAFEVISRHGGKKRTYAIFLNEDGIPTIAKMGEIDTDEHTGLEVKITINPSDFYKFKTKTASALKYFPVKPKVSGVLNFEFDALPTHKIETKNWMLSSTDRYNSSGFVAVQGNVAYRVDGSQIVDSLDSDLANFVNRSHIVAFFEIGDLEVSANREEIRYDKRSIEAIVSRVKAISKEFTHEVEKKIGKVNKKYWYACIELNTLSRELFGREDSIRSFVDATKVKNKNLKRYIEDCGRASFNWKRGWDVARYTINGYYSRAAKLKRHDMSGSFIPEGNTLFVINDVKKGGLGRLRGYLSENNYNEAIVITQRKEPIGDFDNNQKLLKYIGFEAEFKNMVKDFGYPDIQTISAITEEPEVQSTNRDLTYYVYHGTHSSRGSYYAADKISWTLLNHNIDDGGLYIPLKYASTPCLVNSEGALTPLGYGDADDTVNALNFLIAAYNEVNGTDYDIRSLIGLPTAAFNKAKKRDNWVNLFEFGKSVLPDFMDEISFHKRLQRTSSVLDAKNAIKYDEFKDGIRKLSDDSTFKTTMLPLIEGRETHSDAIMNKVAVIDKLHRKLKVEQEIDETPFYDNDAFDKYPMLTLVAGLGYNTEWSKLFDYINLIDRS